MRGAAVLRLHRRPAHEKRRSSAQGERRQRGKLRDVKRPACSKCRPAHGEAAALQHPSQASTRRRCGLAVSQPCRRREEPVETTDAFRPTGGGRGAGCTPSFVSNGESDHSQPADWFPTEGAINPNSQTGVQRPKRSTPIRQTGVQREKNQRQTPTR